MYHLEQAFSDADRAVLLGQALPAGYFSDDNAGRVLDHLFETGTQRIFSALSVAAMDRFALTAKHVHFDTTSVNVFDYANTNDAQATANITYGYSKDKRPDLKHFISMLCVEGGIPIVGKEDGHASTKKLITGCWRRSPATLREHGVAEEAFIYVADSAMVTEENLARAGRFITRLPATYTACEHAILKAIDADHWTQVGCIAATPPTKRRPAASYRVSEQSVELYGTSYRAIVVHSSAHDQRRQKRLERELAASLTAITTQAKACERKTLLLADAQAAAQEAMAQPSAYHRLQVSVLERPRYARGRPKRDGVRTPIAMDYVLNAEILEDEPAIERRRKMAGCFVLLSNVARDGADGEQILRTYKEQYAIERNFSLKDDQIVNALFLKRPERIEALGLILLISLLIWRLMEQVMRSTLKADETTVPGWDNKPTCRPTAYLLTWTFRGVMVLCMGQTRRLHQPLSPTQQAFLRALKIPEERFIHPAPCC
ncbi:IS1634 family transposase [Lamprobacter modestohalophilus]|uniref:IS1634 family transposase n=1 Tax=Lamprobacter modestohalophilus TaxID=1064514 RepID=UPI002ADEB967|nr:IS1634 family transposase [Lamprobacter modestohalophilus]MEA1053208.1 IS1634 family transposase [Lamprobacter modestohalophilus]